MCKKRQRDVCDVFIKVSTSRLSDKELKFQQTDARVISYPTSQQVPTALCAVWSLKLREQGRLPKSKKDLLSRYVRRAFVFVCTAVCLSFSTFVVLMACISLIRLPSCFCLSLASEWISKVLPTNYSLWAYFNKWVRKINFCWTIRRDFAN